MNVTGTATNSTIPIAAHLRRRGWYSAALRRMASWLKLSKCRSTRFSWRANFIRNSKANRMSRIHCSEGLSTPRIRIFIRGRCEVMDIFQILDTESRKRGLQYLVIGGYAVNAHGYSRLTQDLDLLIRKSEIKSWSQIFEQYGLTLSHDGGVHPTFASHRGAHGLLIACW